MKTSVRLITVGIWISTVISAFIAFVGASLLSTLDYRLGNEFVQIEDFKPDSHTETLFPELSEFAGDSGFDVSIYYSSLADSDGELRIYSSALPSGAVNFESQKFQRGEKFVWYPLSEIPTKEPRQVFNIKGSENDARDLTTWLEERGYSVIGLQNLTWSFVMTSSLPLLVAAAFLLALVLGGGHCLVRAREIGIHRLLGLKLSQTLRLDVTRLAKQTWLPFFLAIIFIAAALYLYNDWAEATLFWAFFGVSVLLQWVGLALGYVLGQLLVRNISIPQAIKGKVRARPITYALYAVRLLALLTSLTALSQMVDTSAEVSAREELQPYWIGHANEQEFALSSNSTPDEKEQAAAAAPLRQADREGKLLLADPFWLTWPTQLEAPVILSNHRFAVQAGVAPSEEDVTVCAPVALSEESKQTIIDSVAFEAELAKKKVPDFNWKEDCSLGQVFSYDVELRPVINDPIVVSLPVGLEAIGDRNLLAKASQKVLLAIEPTVVGELKDGTVGKVLATAQPHADSWRSSLEEAKDQFSLWSLNTVVAILLVSLLIVAGLFSFQVAFRRELYVSFICGRSPWKMCRKILLAELFFFVTTIGWVLYRLREHKEQLESHYPSTWSMGFENRWSTATVLAVAAFSIVWMCISIGLTWWISARNQMRWTDSEGN
ncbi:TPA: hypothetical protein KE432_000815 [Corynebacterium striatum]|nr:hypothetical protein [Corynebacterium striatum]